MGRRSQQLPYHPRIITLRSLSKIDINQLLIEQLESLGEALLDFNSIADLENYLA